MRRAILTRRIRRAKKKPRYANSLDRTPFSIVSCRVVRGNSARKVAQGENSGPLTWERIDLFSDVEPHVIVIEARPALVPFRPLLRRCPNSQRSRGINNTPLVCCSKAGGALK